MPTHITNIKKVLLKAIANSQHSIDVAVAYFNDSDLISAITSKQQSGVKVRVLVGQWDNLDLGLFQEFINQGGRIVVAKQEKGIMHIKLSIFDKEIAFLGSYNWTFGATHNNKEILFETSILDEVKMQSDHFENLWLEYAEVETTQEDLVTVLARLDLIRSFTLLAEWNNVNEHLDRVVLNTTLLSSDSTDLLTDLQDAVKHKDRNKVLVLIDQIKSIHQQLSQFQAGEETLLKIQIQWFQQQIKSLNKLYADQADVIRAWDKRLFTFAGDLLRKLFALKTEFAKIRMEASQKKESKAAYEKAQKDQEAFENEEIAFQNAEKVLDESDEKLLKELYRKATGICHPDKADQSDPESIKRATEYMVAVNIAYANKDLDALKLLLQDLENGVGLKENLLHLSSEERLNRLRASLDLLNQEYLSLLESVNNQSKQPSLVNASTCENFDEWLIGFKQQLETEIQVLEKDIARFK